MASLAGLFLAGLGALGERRAAISEANVADARASLMSERRKLCPPFGGDWEPLLDGEDIIDDRRHGEAANIIEQNSLLSRWLPGVVGPSGRSGRIALFIKRKLVTLPTLCRDAGVTIPKRATGVSSS